MIGNHCSSDNQFCRGKKARDIPDLPKSRCTRLCPVMSVIYFVVCLRRVRTLTVIHKMRSVVLRMKDFNLFYLKMLGMDLINSLSLKSLVSWVKLDIAQCMGPRIKLPSHE